MKLKAIPWAAGVIALCLAAAACAAFQGRQATGAQAVTCPNRGPVASAALAAGPDGQLVRPDAITATVCQYHPPGASPQFQSKIALHGAASAGLAALINGAGPVTPHARQCASQGKESGFSQYVIFGYRAAPKATVSITFTTCSLAIATAGKHSGVLPDPIQTDLGELTTLQADPHGASTPDLIGLTFASAAAKADAAHFGLVTGGAVVDPAVRFGTVIFTAPPSGSKVAPPGKQVTLVLAVRTEPACAAGQLALNYIGGEPGAGNDFGAIQVRDVSATPCRLAGPLAVTGLNAAGQRVTVQVSGQVEAPAILSPSASVTQAGLPEGGALTDIISVEAEYRDDPKSPGGVCKPHWVVPAIWSVDLPGGGHVTTPNADGHNPAKLIPSGGFVTCRGKFALISAVNYATYPQS